MLRSMKYVAIPRIVPTNAHLPTSAPLNMSTEIVVNWKNIGISIPSACAYWHKMSPFVACICSEMVTLNHLIKIVPFLLRNAFITSYNRHAPGLANMSRPQPPKPVNPGSWPESPPQINLTFEWSLSAFIMVLMEGITERLGCRDWVGP